MGAARSAGAWSLDPAEVSESWGATNLGRRRRAGHTRAIDVTRGEIRLTHRPTGVEVRGEISWGHRNRVELRRLKSELRAHLWAELEVAVARHLRVPGRGS